MRIYAAIFAVMLLIFFVIKIQGIEFVQISEQLTLAQMLWDLRLTDTLLQSIIIFSSIVAIITTIRGDKVE